MIIDNAQISLSAQNSYRETRETSEQMNFWLTPKAAETPSEGETPQQANQRWLEQVSISDPGKRLLFRGSKGINLNLSQKMDAKAQVNLRILAAFYEAVTGRKLRITDPAELEAGIKTLQIGGEIATPPQATTEARAQATEQAGFGLTYQFHERHAEQETLAVQTSGVIQTQDGRTIPFDASLNMSRAFVEESNLVVRAGDATRVDPLVINFDGKGAQLSQTRFHFDIDSNGSDEQLASLRPGSGFLALDNNGDETINNGTELFGPTSGSGFRELSKFDEDGNHFIDEGDSVYQKLRIWTFNEDGSQQLMALGDAQVGAIFLGHLTSPFKLNDEHNQSLGDVASTGLYVREDGSSGWVQEINLTV